MKNFALTFAVLDEVVGTSSKMAVEDWADFVYNKYMNVYERVREIADNQNFTYKIETYGCQMNVNDSEKIAGMLSSAGFAPAREDGLPDFVILNTCCVREHAEVKIFTRLGVLRKQLEENPRMIVAVCGCMMQQQGMASDIKKRFPFVHIVFGTHNLHELPEMLYKALSGQKTCDIREGTNEIQEDYPLRRNSPPNAFVPIMFGCDNFCSYCVVPYVRGREKSRRPEAVLEEIRNLIDEGYKDITLLGQNVNSYGKGLGCQTSFAALLRRIDALPGVRRVRFMTSHPKDLSDEVIAAMAECAAVCNHLHLPVQSGSDRILSGMNRGYTADEYLQKLGKIRAAVPGIQITTDIIVGFPGETREDFAATMKLIQAAGFFSIYSFMYSKRTGTPAGAMDAQVALSEKKTRLHTLNAAQKEISAKLYAQYVGKRCDVLVEGRSKYHNEWTGKTTCGATVNFASETADTGDIVPVEIIRANVHTLKGQVRN